MLSSTSRDCSIRHIGNKISTRVHCKGRRERERKRDLDPKKPCAAHVRALGTSPKVLGIPAGMTIVPTICAVSKNNIKSTTLTRPTSNDDRSYEYYDGPSRRSWQQLMLVDSELQLNCSTSTKLLVGVDFESATVVDNKCS